MSCLVSWVSRGIDSFLNCVQSAFAVSLSNNYLLHRKYNLELLIRDGSPVPSIVSAAAADADKAVDDKPEEDEARA